MNSQGVGAKFLILMTPKEGSLAIFRQWQKIRQFRGN